MRLIDADRLIERLRNAAAFYGHETAGDFDTGRKLGLIEAKEKVAEEPTIEVEPVKHGRWIMREKDKLVPTGKIAVSEGHILSKTSSDEPFTLQSENLIQIKEHRTVKKPYCSICGNYGDDEYDKTPYCPNCGAKMDGD